MLNLISLKELDIMTKNDFINFITNSNLDILYNIKNILDDYYYNSESIIDDYKYDILLEYIKKIDSKYINNIGSKIRDNDIDIKLPFWLGSLDKIKLNEPDKLEKWIYYIKYNQEVKSKETKYVITDKLDGISCMLYKDNNKISLYTRGDGKIGKDISHILKYINFIPNNLPDKICIRGELVISKKNFLKINNDYLLMRNCVSGLIKSKTFKNELNLIDFVAYEIISNSQKKLSDQLSILIDMDFRIVYNKIISDISIDILKNILLDRKKICYYDIDGIVIQHDLEYTRNQNGNPSYSIAFKIDTSIETNILDIEWNITMSGILKPIIKINPVNISGAVINYITGYNANYIVKNCLGIDSIVEVTRSGEVIPKIIDIIKPSPFGPKLPDIEYKWGDTNIDIYAINPGNEMKIKIIQHFMQTLNIKYINESTINKLVLLGYDSIIKILEMNKSDFMKIDNCKYLLSNKLYNNIHNSLINIEISQLMAASNCFGYGLGIKRLELVNKKYPNLYINYNNYTKDELLKMITDIDGISNIMAYKIIDGFIQFTKFYNEINKYVKLKKEDNNLIYINEIKDKKFVLSGFRKIIEDDIIKMGGIITNNISKNTFMLIVKDKNISSSKMNIAIELGIPIKDITEFKEYIKDIK